MKSSMTKGMVFNKSKVNLSNVTVKAESTKGLTTVSLADERQGVMIQVNYDTIKKLVESL